MVDGIILSTPMYFFRLKVPGYAPHINLAISALYYIIFVYLWGRTPGKMFFKLKIVTADLRKPGLREAVLRYVGMIFSQALMFLGYIIMLWDRDKQTLHDKIARTYVVIDADSVN